MSLDLIRHPDAAPAVEHGSRLQRDAVCCRPSVARRGVARALAWLRAGQLGPVDNYCACA